MASTESALQYLGQARAKAEEAGGPTVDQLTGFATVSAMLALVEEVQTFSRVASDQNEAVCAHLHDLTCRLTIPAERSA
jgi:hypothetical protein